MSRQEIDWLGGASASPACTCARVNQRASSSSPPTRTSLPGAARACKPRMTEEGNGQGCEEC